VTATRYNAWRFGHPDLGAADEVGLRFDPAGGVAMVAGDASVRQAIMLLLSTMPGERVMRPHYGCSLHRLAFAANDPTTAGLAMHYVRQAIERWEPRVAIVRLDAGPALDRPERLDIELDYKVRATSELDQVRFGFDLRAGGA